MKTIHILCTVQVTSDEYSELLNSNSTLSIPLLVRKNLDGKSSKITFSDPLILIPLPPKSE